jgi:hypothetical protein
MNKNSFIYLGTMFIGKNQLTKIFLLSIFLIFLGSQTFAATYYVDASAANDSGMGAIGSPKKYIPSGIKLMSSNGGDVLIIKSGTYSGASNNLTSFTGGTSSAYNIIKAEIDGGVIVSSSFSVGSGNYVRIEGLKFIAASTKSCDASYIKFLRCAFQGGATCSSGCDGEVVFAAGSYQLYEDCWFYGVGGRYTLATYEGHDDVFRRCIIRRDGGYVYDGSNPEAPLVNYGSYNMSYQNCIIIDNNLTYSGGYSSSIYATGHTSNPASSNVAFIGCIELNGKGASFDVDTDDRSTGMSFTDCVFYKNETGIADGNTGVALTLNRLTLGSMSHDAISRWNGSIALTNGVIFNHTADGDGSKTVTYTNSYNPNSYSGTVVTHINPVNNGLLYLPRIETGSTLKTSGSGGGQMGAQIIYKIGIDGTLYGESGYNTVTTNALWPWPNEDRIKSDFASVTNGARGFATGNSKDGTSQTLTKYIWEYLGNQIPSDIYSDSGGGSTVEVPGAPQTLSIVQ